MFQLMQVLYSIRHKAFSLWSLTVAEWDFPSCSESSTWKAKIESKGFRHLTVAAHGVMINGGYADLLRVSFVKPGKTPSKVESVPVPAEVQPFHSFSPDEIRRCADTLGDPCAAHQEGSVVPPLLLLQTLLRQNPIHSGQIRFHAPVAPDTMVYLLRTAAGIDGYTDGVKVFDVSMN